MRRVQNKVRTGTEETVKESDSGRRPFINRVRKTLFNIRLLQFLVICIIIMSYGVIVMLVYVLIAVIGKYLHNNSDLFSRYSSDKKRKGTPVSGNKIAREEGDLFLRYSSDKKRKGTPVSGNTIAGEEGDLFLRYSSDKKRKGTPVSGNKIADCEETKKDFVDKVLELLTNHETVVTESHCDYRGIQGFDTYTKLLELLTTQVEAVPENCKRQAKERIVINVIAVLKNPGVKAVLKIDWENGERQIEGIMREVQNVVRTGTEETVNESDSDCEGIGMEDFVTEVLVLLRKQSISWYYPYSDAVEEECYRRYSPGLVLNEEKSLQSINGSQRIPPTTFMSKISIAVIGYVIWLNSMPRKFSYQNLMLCHLVKEQWNMYDQGRFVNWPSRSRRFRDQNRILPQEVMVRLSHSDFKILCYVHVLNEQWNMYDQGRFVNWPYSRSRRFRDQNRILLQEVMREVEPFGCPRDEVIE